MQTTLTSVISAAVIGGDLIIGLSDGSIINCGRVQGPQGLTGDQGPMGATGRSGTNGNTILTVQGAPDTTVGKDGDFAINVTVWEIYGPRAGGVWGTGTPLRGNARGGQSPATTQNLFGSNSPGGGGGGGGGLQAIQGGKGITATPQGNPDVIEIDADIDTGKGLEFVAGKIAIQVGNGLEFDATTGAIKSKVNAADYAQLTYVDAQDDALSVRIDAADVRGSDNANAIAANTAEITANSADIDNLQIKVEALEGASMAGIWSLALNGSPRPGKVLLYKEGFQPGVTTWDDVKTLGFYPEDAGGTTHDFSNVIVGEYIRFTETTTVGEEDACTFIVTDTSSGPSGVFGVSVGTQKGQPVNDEQFKVEFLPPFDPSQYATVDYVDAEDALKVNKSGDTLSAQLTFKVGGETVNALSIQNKTNTKTCLQLWAPGGTGTQNKFVGRHGTALWFQNYTADDDDVLTTAKFEHEYYYFQAKSGVSYEATDKHSFTGSVNLTGPTTVSAGFAVKTPGANPESIFQVVTLSTPGASKAEYFGSVSTSKSIATKEYVDSSRSVTQTSTNDILKTITAASADFADFQARVAAL